MTAQTKSKIQYVLAILLTSAFFVLLLSAFGWIGRAFAQGVGPLVAQDDPVSMVQQGYEFMRSGKGTAAVGVVTMLLVWALRNPLLFGRFDFFKTKLGGYVLNFGTALAQYVAGTLVANEPVTFALFANAFGAGFLAAGGWEGLKDLLNSKSTAIKVTTVTLLLGTTLSLTPGCGPNGPLPVIGSVTVDCVKQERDRIDELLNEFVPLVTGGQANWDVIYQRAKLAGTEIGGCFLGELVQIYLGGRRAPENGDGWMARDTFEKFRKTEANNATFRTKDGDL